MPFGQSDPNSEVTPARSTRLHLDLPEKKMLAAGFAGVRAGADIASVAAKTGGRDSASTTGVRWWPGAKCWTLEPMQDKVARFSEALPDYSIIENFRVLTRQTMMNEAYVEAFAELAEQALYFTPDGVGMVHEPGTPNANDYFYTKQVGANGSYAGALTPSGPPSPMGTPGSGQQASGKPPFVAQLAPPITYLDCNLETNTDERPDQGFHLRWMVPGTPAQHFDYTHVVYLGQYGLVFTGDGLTHITEYCRPADGSAYRWVLRDTFRYSKPSQVVGVSHSLTIFPVFGLAGACIEFTGATVEGAGVGGGVANPQGYTYVASDLMRSGDLDEAPGHVTKAARYRVDVRRDVRLIHQTTRLAFLPSGFLWDGVWGGRGMATNPPYTVRAIVHQPWPANVAPVSNPAQVTSTLVQNDTGDPIPTGYSGPVGVRFDLTGHVANEKKYAAETPILYSYHLVAEPTVQTVNPATVRPDLVPVSLPVVSLDFTCQGPNPNGDGGEGMVFDQTNAAARLRTRGVLPAKVTTDAVKPDGSPALVTLFRGEVIRPRFKRYGKPGSVFPHELSGGFSVPLSGMADRLTLSALSSRMIDYRLFVGSEDLSQFHNMAETSLQGWRITSIVKYLLGLAFPPEMIAVEQTDDDIRLFSSTQTATDADFSYDPHVDIVSKCQALVRNYLGGFLVFDVAAGDLAPAGRADAGSPEGAWRIIYTPEEGTAPLLNFVTGPDLSEGPRLPLAAASYAPGTVVECDRAESYPVPPEINHVHVLTSPLRDGDKKGYRYDAHVYNVLSYDVPGFTTPADPLSPHWIGREQLRIVPDPSLYIPNNPQETQAACNYIARRILNHAGRGAIVRPIWGPLQFVTDADTGRLRLPRFGHPCTYDGTPDYFIRSVSPAYNLDKAQMAHYEIIRFEPLFTATTTTED